jgi:hypothetical protein
MEGGNSLATASCDHDFSSSVSDLISLIGHVQSSIKLVESAIVRESSHGDQDNDGNVVVLDDVTPCYAEANSAPIACNVSLSTVLKSLLDASSPLHTW